MALPSLSQLAEELRRAAIREGSGSITPVVVSGGYVSPQPVASIGRGSGGRRRASESSPLQRLLQLVPQQLRPRLEPVLRAVCLGSEYQYRWCLFLLEQLSGRPAKAPGQAPPPQLLRLVEAIGWNRVPPGLRRMLERAGVAPPQVKMEEVAQELMKQLVEALRRGRPRVVHTTLRKLIEAVREGQRPVVMAMERSFEEMAKRVGAPNPRAMARSIVSTILKAARRPTPVAMKMVVAEIERVVGRKAVAERMEEVKKRLEQEASGKQQVIGEKGGGWEKRAREELQRVLRSMRRGRPSTRSS